MKKFGKAVNDLSREILTLQGNGDKAAVEEIAQVKGQMPADLKSDLESLVEKGIPVDLVFEQGLDVLSLK